MPSFPPQYTNPTPRTKRDDFWTVSGGATPGRPGKKQKTLVTLSGGQDSSLVTWVLFHTEHYYPCRPQSLYYQHFLQPDALYAQKHCAQLSFWFNWETLYYLATRQYASEKNAGDWRRDSSLRLSSYYTSPFLFKGQSLTDQHETKTATLLRTFIQAAEKHGGTQKIASSPTHMKNTPTEDTKGLFVQSKTLSRWNPTKSERTPGRQVKFYKGIKYGL